MGLSEWRLGSVYGIYSVCICKNGFVIKDREWIIRWGFGEVLYGVNWEVGLEKMVGDRD